MIPTVFVIAVVTFFSTLIGGTFAIKFKKALPYFFAFAAGSLIAVTFFDILPEGIAVSEASGIPIRTVMATIVGSFLVYSLLERYFLTHHHHEEDDEDHGHVMGPVGAGGLVVHSFLDGAAIGTAYQANPALGLIVAFAVIFHDFTDGINTVTLMLRSKQNVKNAFMFLLADSIAPAFGIALTSLIVVPEYVLAYILAMFAGEFLYLAAVNLLPETFKHPGWKMFLATLLGISLIFVLTGLISA
jgi:zinc transporter ZupT